MFCKGVDEAKKQKEEQQNEEQMKKEISHWNGSSNDYGYDCNNDNKYNNDNKNSTEMTPKYKTKNIFR
ncbi:hypothetical protein RFI_33044 [Reticulomyxa filosa]|uniref:Uncharacterized protein n=1 Tax=Reticulomyxa filosa TaxID=46433 RepID=X6LR59_RETFI|nr:hypothetical protein RFI_33044 [Reticulomyxa filosa]|eukprot:ETO04353.1 hypothetical protein RFI_33044 [Reticulomyxa filosa]